MERLKQTRFEKLSDVEKIEVMQAVSREVLKVIRMARSPASDYTTFLALLGGDSFKDCLAALEEIAEWSPQHDRLVQQKVTQLQRAVKDTPRLDEKVHKLRNLAFIGTGVGVGGIVGYCILRMKRRRKQRAGNK